MKSSLIALALLLTPSAAIADNLPANYMIWRGKAYNLDALWGRGTTQATTQNTPPTVQTVPTISESRESRDNRQRVEFENARTQILIERLNNQR